MEEVGSSNPVFLIIHKKAAIRSYLCSAFQKRSFLPLKQQKTMKNALFFMVFCLAAFSSAIMAAPDRACPCGAKFGGRGCRHCPPHRTSVLSAGAAKTRHSACYTAFMAPQVGFEPTTLRFNSASLHALRVQPAPVNHFLRKYIKDVQGLKNKKHEHFCSRFSWLLR